MERNLNKFSRESKLAAVFFEYKRRGGIIVIGRVSCVLDEVQKGAAQKEEEPPLLCHWAGPARFLLMMSRAGKSKKRSPSMCVSVCVYIIRAAAGLSHPIYNFFSRCVYASVLCTKVERIVGPLLHLASEKRDSINRYPFFVEERLILLCIHTTDGPPLFLERLY